MIQSIHSSGSIAGLKSYAQSSVGVAKKILDMEEANGQAAVKLIEAAPVGADPNLGQNIDIVV